MQIDANWKVMRMADRSIVISSTEIIGAVTTTKSILIEAAQWVEVISQCGAPSIPLDNRRVTAQKLHNGMTIESPEDTQ